MLNSGLRCALVGLFLIGVSACSDGKSAKFIDVTGKVTLEKEPVANASITFTPRGNSEGLPGIGMTVSDGSYSLMGPQGQKGLMPGEYTVTISRRLNPDGSPVPADDPTPPIESKAKESLPAIYSDANRSQLSARISADAPTADFKLTKKK